MSPFPAAPRTDVPPVRPSRWGIVGVVVLGLALRCACQDSSDDADHDLVDAHVAGGSTGGADSAAVSAASAPSPTNVSDSDVEIIDPGDEPGDGRASERGGATEGTPAGEAIPENAMEAGVAEGGVAEGGAAEGGVAEGGVAEGGVAEGGVAEGGATEGPAEQGGAAEGSADAEASASPTPLQLDGSRLAEAQMTPEELLAAAKTAYSERKFRDAYRLANRSHYQRPSPEALLLAGKAACELRDRDLAKTAMKGFKRSDPERKTIRETCQRRDVRVGF